MVVDRNAFLYLAPKPRDDKQSFAQCGSCRLFTGNGCVIHGSKVEVDDDDSCGFYVDWPNGKIDPKVVANHKADLERGVPGSVTPEESGLVGSLVQCHRCDFYSEGKCGLFEKLNAALPRVFKLNVKVEPHACCNAWTERTKKASIASRIAKKAS